MDEQLAISIQHCAQLLGCSRKHVYHLINTDPSFPQPFKLGRASRLLLSSLTDWLEAKSAEANERGRLRSRRSLRERSTGASAPAIGRAVESINPAGSRRLRT